jgi:hypothetical protein
MRRGTLYAITPDEAATLLSLVGNDVALAREALDLYTIERQKAHLIAGLDKSWDVIHRCLTDGAHRDFGKGTTPLSWCLLGGQSLHSGKEYIVCYTTADQAAQAAAALDEIDVDWFLDKYRRLPSAGYTGPISNEDFEYSWDYFTNTRNLYSKAAASSRGVVFVTDQ